jgi:hypothetical protein
MYIWKSGNGLAHTVALIYIRLARHPQEAGSRKQEAGSRKQEAGSRKQDAGCRKQDAGSSDRVLLIRRGQ